MLMLGERMLQAKLDKAAGAGLRLQHAMRALRLQRCEQQLQLISKAQVKPPPPSHAAFHVTHVVSRSLSDHRCCNVCDLHPERSDRSTSSSHAGK